MFWSYFLKLPIYGVIDCHALNPTHDQLNDLLVHRVHPALNDSEMFGQGGECFMRLNVGTSRQLLERALKQLEKAIPKI